jgi:hypothetical protein
MAIKAKLSSTQADPFMETLPVSLALFDFLPPLAFLVGAFFLIRIARLWCGKPTIGMILVGSLLVFLGGFLKVIWKLLYVTNVADIQWMSQSQFILSAIGFLGMLVGIIYMVRGLRNTDTAGVTILAIAAWKIPFLFLMILASLGSEGILVYLSFMRKTNLAAVGFIFSVLSILVMGAMTSSEQTLTLQWVEEVVNAIGQLGFMLGCILLFHNFKAKDRDATSLRLTNDQ